MKLNHVLVKTRDLSAMTKFWTKYIGLEVGERPPFPFPGAWLYSNGQALVHLVEDPMIERSNAVLSHVALEGANYADLIKTLKDNLIPYNETDVPLSGERQVFVRGPDGLNVEMLFDIDQLNTASDSDNNHKATTQFS